MKIELNAESIIVTVCIIDRNITAPVSDLDGLHQKNKILCIIPTAKNPMNTANAPPAKYKYVTGPIAVEEK